MIKVIAVASAKGGVGKTTVAVNLAAALVGFGRQCIVIDADLHAPNIGLHLGSPAVPVSLNQVLRGDAGFDQAVYLHPSGIRVMPASIGVSDSLHAPHENLAGVIDHARSCADMVIVDCPSGLGKEARSSLVAADAVLPVTMPDLVSVTDALRTVHLSKNLRKDAVGVVVNQVFPDAELSLANVATLMELPVVAAIPLEASVQESLRLRHPVVFSHPESIASLRFKELAATVLGDRYLSGLHPKQ